MPPKSKRSLQLKVARRHRHKRAKTQECSSTMNESISEDVTEEHIIDTTLELSSIANPDDMSENETKEVIPVSTEGVVPVTGNHGATTEEIIPTFSDYDSQDDEEYTSPGETATEDELIHGHAKDWISSLDRDDVMSLSLVLHHLIVNILGLQLTFAAKVIGDLIGKSDRTVREWRGTFLCNDGSFPGSLQGKYQRTGVLEQNEELNKHARKYVRENANVKGRPNMTTASFCQWVNNELLPNSVLEPGFPRKISVDTARRWLHHLDFQVLDRKKSVYIDGHEREDVVAYRKKFIRKMVSIGFINEDNAPTAEASQCLPEDLRCPSEEQLQKTIVLFHDESIFSANEDQGTQWGEKDNFAIKPKSKGSGIMVSDFIDEFNGYLCLSDSEYSLAKQTYGDNITKEARQFLEYGENREGYWTSDKFLTQMDHAVKIADIKYPKDQGYRVVWVFDNSSCHNAYAEDALNANNMNAKPGGKQPHLRDTVWNGRPQRMVFNIGIPKGLIQVLTERGKYHKSMKLEDMRKEISTHPDFMNEMTKLEHFLRDRGHICIMLPKFHCELNPIERCWGQAKRYTRSFTNYTLPRLRINIPNGLDSVTLENIKNYFRKVRQYMFAYLEGFTAGPDLEKTVKAYKKVYKSHRKIGVNS